MVLNESIREKTKIMMNYKRYTLAFVYTFLISVMVCLSIDLKADYKRMTGASLIISVMFTLLLLNFEKPVRKWYRENFDKKYKYNKIKPIVKEKKETEKEKTPAE
jgi:hypothetical protein